MERCWGRVLIVDDDEAIATLVAEVLSDEGYAASVLADGRTIAIQDAITRLEPDCILLDGGAGHGYGESWDTAALMATRLLPMPVIMFTGYSGAAAEVRENVSERSRAAKFAAVVTKPFELHDLLTAIESAIGRSRASNNDGRLSASTLDVLRCSATGMASSEVAASLGISVAETQRLLSRAIVTLGACSKLEAVLIALRLGLIDPPERGQIAGRQPAAQSDDSGVQIVAGIGHPAAHANSLSRTLAVNIVDFEHHHAPSQRDAH